MSRACHLRGGTPLFPASFWRLLAALSCDNTLIGQFRGGCTISLKIRGPHKLNQPAPGNGHGSHIEMGFLISPSLREHQLAMDTSKNRFASLKRAASRKFLTNPFFQV